MSAKITLLTDLDRTLLPNGAADETPGVRAMLATLVAGELVETVYVSGRDLGLIVSAIAQYDLPRPRALVADVGTAIYLRDGAGWRLVDGWADRIRADFGAENSTTLTTAFEDLAELRLQEPERQGPAKLSYYAPPGRDAAELRAAIVSRASRRGAAVRVIHSIDEETGLALVDVLPASASKWHAIEYLLAELGIAPERALFAGDSGNDLEVLAGPLQAVLVANASDAVRHAALTRAESSGHGAALYLARGDYLGMNGNYCGGILEGLAAVFPEIDRALRAAHAAGDRR